MPSATPPHDPDSGKSSSDETLQALYEEWQRLRQSLHAQHKSLHLAAGKFDLNVEPWQGAVEATERQLSEIERNLTKSVVASPEGAKAQAVVLATYFEANKNRPQGPFDNTSMVALAARLTEYVLLSSGVTLWRDED